ncbi:MAG: hypothetical protein ACLP5H_27495 [Desulfomonilaceae bacterium]
MRFRLLKIVTWLVVVIVLTVAISVAVLRIFVFTGGEHDHSSVVRDRTIAVVQTQPHVNSYTRGSEVRTRT